MINKWYKRRSEKQLLSCPLLQHCLYPLAQWRRTLLFRAISRMIMYFPARAVVQSIRTFMLYFHLQTDRPEHIIPYVNARYEHTIMHLDLYVEYLMHCICYFELQNLFLKNCQFDVLSCRKHSPSLKDELTEHSSAMLMNHFK